MERLNKFLAHAGHGSRRHVEDLIRAGRVTVDGHPVRELGTKVEPGQKVAVDGVLHTGDPTPLVLAGPTVRPDDVTEFGERAARQGWYGVVRADELLALLFSHANRPMFLGHRMASRQSLALPDRADPMPLE